MHTFRIVNPLIVPTFQILSLRSQCLKGKSFRRDTGIHHIPVSTPDIRFNRDHFHHFISRDTRSTCKVHIQQVKTTYTCAV